MMLQQKLTGYRKKINFLELNGTIYIKPFILLKVPACHQVGFILLYCRNKIRDDIFLLLKKL